PEIIGAVGDNASRVDFDLFRIRRIQTGVDRADAIHSDAAATNIQSRGGPSVLKQSHAAITSKGQQVSVDGTRQVPFSGGVSVEKEAVWAVGRNSYREGGAGTGVGRIILIEKDRALTQTKIEYSIASAQHGDLAGQKACGLGHSR